MNNQHPNTPSPTVQPTKPTKAPPISKQNAREMQARAVAARLRRKQLRAQGIDPDAPQVQATATANTPATVNPELELVERQIMRVTAQLEDDMEPNERAQLVRALDLMLDRKRILQERPLPGSRRPAPETSRPRVASLLGASRVDQPAAGTPQEQE